MCSELTPCARIPDTRIPQFMQPWSAASTVSTLSAVCIALLPSSLMIFLVQFSCKTHEESLVQFNSILVQFNSILVQFSPCRTRIRNIVHSNSILRTRIGDLTHASAHPLPGQPHLHCPHWKGDKVDMITVFNSFSLFIVNFANIIYIEIAPKTTQ